MPEHTLPDITEVRELAGKYVLLRASLNVPLKNGVVRNHFRIKRALATIEYLVAHGARVIIVAHIGREATDTLQPVYDALTQYIDIAWCPSLTGPEVRSMGAALGNGDVLLLENLRSHAGETENDPTLARELAAYADYYVNDAFAASHRSHASLVGVPQHVPAYFGMNFIREYEVLRGARSPMHPALFVLGGAKFETKMPLVTQFLATYDQVFIGGALAHDIWRARGYQLGKSLVSDVDLSKSALISAPNLLLPIDVTVVSPKHTRVTTPDDVASDETILDAGPKTVAMLASYANAARTVLWNGPLGSYERGFATTTEQFARVIADAPGHSIVGGGDTIASIESLCLSDQFDFLSTAGGAMLSFLETGSLPAIEAVLRS